jgi:hypothetical protein
VPITDDNVGALTILCKISSLIPIQACKLYEASQLSSVVKLCHIYLLKYLDRPRLKHKVPALSDQLQAVSKLPSVGSRVASKREHLFAQSKEIDK